MESLRWGVNITKKCKIASKTSLISTLLWSLKIPLFTFKNEMGRSLALIRAQPVLCQTR